MSSNIELIGDGGYGCVIQPPVVPVVHVVPGISERYAKTGKDGKTRYDKTYVEYTDNRSNDIGKLFLEKRHFVEELKLLKGIQQIDRDSTFTVKLKGANSFNSKLLTNNSVLKCLNIYMNTDVYQIVMEYGGKDLHKLPNYNIPFKTFMKQLRPLLEGLMKFHSYDMIHYDIKPSNVLVSDDKISLIDFGISISADKVYTSENKRLSSIYIYHPAELFIASFLTDYKNSHSSFQSKLETVLDEMTRQEYFENIWEENKIDMVKEELSDFIDEIISRDYSFDDVFNKNLAFKCDVYSLSFVIKEFSSKIKYENDMQKEFVRELYAMCSPVNPFKRASLKRIMEYFKESERTLSRPNTMGLNGQMDQIGGSKKRLRFAKMHKESARVKSQELPLKYKLPQIVNKHLKKQ